MKKLYLKTDKIKFSKLKVNLILKKWFFHILTNFECKYDII